MILIKLLPLWLTLSLMTAATRPERRRRDVFNRLSRWDVPIEQTLRMLTKRSDNEYTSCSCDEVEGKQFLGENIWPRYITSRICPPKPKHFYQIAACKALGEDIVGVQCKQRKMPVKVLRRRLQSEPQPQFVDLPRELQEDWQFVDVYVNSGCELVRNSDLPSPD